MMPMSVSIIIASARSPFRLVTLPPTYYSCSVHTNKNNIYSHQFLNSKDVHSRNKIKRESQPTYDRTRVTCNPHVQGIILDSRNCLHNKSNTEILVRELQQLPQRDPHLLRQSILMCVL